MVSFICDACGKTVKKQKVEKHYQTECRNCNVLSCIDCGRDFPGESYATHTSCISEAEKYQGKLYKAKDKSNKGERKQQEWLEKVRNVTNETEMQDPRVRKLLARIAACDNVPRKENKFKKFCENSLNVKDSTLLEKFWKVFSEVECKTLENNIQVSEPDETEAANEQKPDTQCSVDNNFDSTVKNDEVVALCNGASKENRKCKREKVKKKKRKYEEGKQENETNGKIEDNCNRKKKQKRGKEGFNIQESNDDSIAPVDSYAESGKFKWNAIIKKLLKSAPDQEMSLKKLRKKVINEYVAQGVGTKPKTEQELYLLFEKKVNKNPKIKVHKEKAKFL